MYYLVTDTETDETFVCRADTKWRAIAKANNFWYSNEDYIVLGQVKVEEITKEEFEKYVNR